MEADTEIYEPVTAEFKDVKEFEYFNVLLILQNKVIQNNLFSNFDLAVHNFINIIREYADIPVTKEVLAQAVDTKFLYIKGGAVCISNPNVKM